MSYSGAGFILLSSDYSSTLLINDARSGKWGFPKGHRENTDANDIETAVRECREETGLAPDDYVVINKPFRVSKGSQSYLFRYAVAKENVRLRPGPAYEIRDIRWVPIADLVQATNVMDGNKYLRSWISDIQSNASKKHVHMLREIIASREQSTVSVSAPA